MTKQPTSKLDDQRSPQKGETVAKEQQDVARSEEKKDKVSSWGTVAGGGAAAGAITGIVIAYMGGGLWFVAFIIWFLLVFLPIRPWSRRFVASVIFAAVAPLVALIFQL